MYSFTDYVKVKSLDEAQSLLDKSPRNRILGGGMWLRLGRAKYGTAIDLSELSLDRIAEEDGVISIGCMVTLRQLETDPLLNGRFGALPGSVRDIVGVQFRACATVGGTVYGRYGFSDLMCALCALDARIEVYGKGIFTAEEFLARPYGREIVTRVLLDDSGRRADFESFRQTKTDFSVVNVCVSDGDNDPRVFVGARPGKPARCRAAEECLKNGDVQGARAAVEGLAFGSNMRGSEAYRRHMAGVLFERAVKEVRA